MPTEYRMVRIRPHVKCPTCGTVFKALNWGQTYCSRQCYKADIQYPRRKMRSQDIVPSPSKPGAIT